MKKKIVSIIAVFAILTGILSGCMGIDVTKIATVNGKEILKSEYIFYCEQMGLNYASYYAANGMSVNDLWGQQMSEDQTLGDYIKASAMDAMKEDYVLCAKAEELGITLTAEDKNQATEQKRAIMSALGGASQYNTFLDKADLTDDKVIEILQNQVLADKVKEALLASDGEEEEADKDAVAEYYESNYYKAKHILIMSTPQEATTTPDELEETEATEDQEEAEVSEDQEKAEVSEAQEKPQMTEEEYKEDAKKRAQAILDQLNGGADFDKLMNENSEDTGLETNPDGYVFTDGTMVSVFEDAVKELKPGEYTKELVESDYGYHIIKRLELTRDDEDFTENYDQYVERYKAHIWDDMLKGLMDSANIWIDTNVQSKVDISKLYWGSQN